MLRHTSRTAAGLALIASVVTTTAAEQGASAASRSSMTDASQRVIVVLRHAAAAAGSVAAAARVQAALRDQYDVLDRLSGPAPQHVVHLSVADAFAASVDSAQAAALAADPGVAFVAPDVSIRLSTPTAAGSTAVPATGHPSTRLSALASESPFAICPSDPAQPLSEPEALNSIHALTTDGTPQAQDLTTGSGVRVAFLADGVDTNNPDFIRPGGARVFADYRDFSGEGPDAPSAGAQAFGAASAIAAQGTVSHDLSQFVNQAHPLPPGCNITITGVAPGVRLYGFKVGSTFASTSAILQAIDYAVRVDHVNVIDEPFALSDFPDDSTRKAVKIANDNAVASGVTVTVASGNAGVNSTIGDAAADGHVISVGDTTDNQVSMQTAAAAAPFSNGHWASDNVSSSSSGGFTQHGRLIDLVAPGDTNWAVCEPGFTQCVTFRSPPGPSDIQPFGGTEASAAMTAGTAALVIAAYRSTHGGKRPTPAVVKQIITGTATDLTLPPSEQGSGLLNARAATEAALTWPGATTAAPAGVKSNIVTSRDQVTLIGAGGSTHSSVVTVTNVGKKKLTIAAGTRRFRQVAEAAQALAFDSTTLPTFTDSNGTQSAFKIAHFNVAAGTTRLVQRMAWAGSSDSDAVMRMTLLAPDGTLVTNSQPRGGAASANYATVDVRNPAAGTWSTVMSSTAGSAGYTGVVGLIMDQYRSVAVGSVTPATFTLSPGKSQAVTLRLTLPETAVGDQDDALTIASSDGHQTAVGVTLRTQIDPATAGQGNYSGVITGGTGQASAPAETASYSILVPAHKAGLSVTLLFPNDPAMLADLVLLAPDGQVADITSNQPVSGGTSDNTRIQSFVAAPVPGRWTLVVVAQQPAPGTMFEQPFTGRVRFSTVTVKRGTLPNAATTKLKRGVAKTFSLTVTNTGVQSMLVGVDARTSSYVSLQPVPVRGQSVVSLPADPAQMPAYTIPPDTTSATVSASSSVPSQLELVGPGGGVDAVGGLSAAQQGSSISIAKTSESGTGNFIAHGLWSTSLQEIGPFTDDGETAGQSTLNASVTTRGFDSTITSNTGDPYGNAFEPPRGGDGTPVVIDPGQTTTITIQLTPRARVGVHVTGILNLVTVPEVPVGTSGLPLLSTGEVLSVIPYSYTVS